MTPVPSRLALAALVMTALIALQPLQAGSLTLSVNGSDGEPLGDAVAYIESPGLSSRADDDPRPQGEVDQRDQQFLPHAQAIQRGASVRFPNNDQVRHHVFSFSKDQAREELAVGGRVFQSLLAARQEQLLDNAELLADDFGFREAVASGEATTIASALRNHGGRIGADAAMVASVDGDMIADAEGARDARFPFPRLLERADAEGKAAAIVVLDNRPVQAAGTSPKRTSMRW